MAKRGRKPKVIDLPGTLPVREDPPKAMEPSHVELARKLSMLGADEPRVARVFGIHTSTLSEWKVLHPELGNALNEGKEYSDANVAQSLYHRATGFSHKAVKIFCDPKTGSREIVEYIEHYPPDTTACIFWLKNRQPAMWRDRIEHTGANGGAIKTEQTIKPELLTPDDRDVLRAILAQATPDEERPVAERGRMQ